jgi:valyl-tRNA synthetase
VSDETKAALADAAKSNTAMGQHTVGKDAGSKVGTAEAGEGEKKVKSEKERMEAS